MCQNTKETDLSPLRGMPLKSINCDFKPERDENERSSEDEISQGKILRAV